MRQARIVPEQENGKSSASASSASGPTRCSATLGMENGDRLETINGFDMTSPEKALEAYARLRTADHLTVSVNRKGPEHEPRLQHQVSEREHGRHDRTAIDNRALLQAHARHGGRDGGRVRRRRRDAHARRASAIVGARRRRRPGDATASAADLVAAPAATAALHARRRHPAVPVAPTQSAKQSEPRRDRTMRTNVLVLAAAVQRSRSPSAGAERARAAARRARRPGALAAPARPAPAAPAAPPAPAPRRARGRGAGTPRRRRRPGGPGARTASRRRHAGPRAVRARGRVRAARPDDKVAFSLEDADLPELVRVIGELTGKRFIFGGKVRNIKATVFSPQKVTVAEAYQAFLSILEANGLTVVPHGRFHKIVDSPDAKMGAPVVRRRAGRAGEDRYVTRIHRLRNVERRRGRRTSSATSRSKDGDITVYGPGNLLIITDTGSNIQRMMQILEDVDVGGVGRPDLDRADPLRRRVRHRDAPQRALRPQGGRRAGGRGKAGEQGRAAVDGGDVHVAKIVADDRSNSLVIVATERAYLRILEFIKRLDVPADGGGGDPRPAAPARRRRRARARR